MLKLVAESKLLTMIDTNDKENYQRKMRKEISIFKFILILTMVMNSTEIIESDYYKYQKACQWKVKGPCCDT